MTHEWKGPTGQDVCRRCGLKRGAAGMFGIDDCMPAQPTREETLHAEIDHLRAQLAAARQCADDWKVCAERERDAALEEVWRALNGLWDSAQRAVDRANEGTEARAYCNGKVAAFIQAINAVRALKSKT